MKHPLDELTDDLYDVYKDTYLQGGSKNTNTDTSYGEYKFQVEGNVVYLLEETGKYHKGSPIVENKFTISVAGAATKEEKEKLTLKIANLLNKELM